MTASPPPLHPTHPGAPINQVTSLPFAPPPPLHPSSQSYGSQASYGRPPSRPQTQPTTPTGSSAFPPRPPSQGRPTGGTSHVTPAPAPPLPSSNNVTGQGQWPPPEWGTQRPSQTPQGGPATQTPASQYGQTGGANLSRPNTFSANSYGPSNPPRPSGGTVGPPRPSTTLPYSSGTSAPSTPGVAPASNTAASNNTGYGAPPSIQYSYSGPATPGFTMPSGPSGSMYPSMPGQDASYISQQAGSGTHLPYGATGSYQPAYPGGGPGAPSFPTSAYPQAPVSHHSSGGPSPHTSPPISPGAANTTYPNSHPNLYSDMPGGQSLYAPHVAQFPTASPAGGDINYFGQGSMPQGHVPPTSSYPPSVGQYESYGMTMPSSYQSGGSSYAQSPSPGSSGAMGVPAPMPWVPGGSSGSQQTGPPPSLPPTAIKTIQRVPRHRPARRRSHLVRWASDVGTTSGAGASALGLALSAVDKVAGKKTTEQLANLAQYRGYGDSGRYPGTHPKSLLNPYPLPLEAGLLSPGTAEMHVPGLGLFDGQGRGDTLPSRHLSVDESICSNIVLEYRGQGRNVGWRRTSEVTLSTRPGYVAHQDRSPSIGRSYERPVIKMGALGLIRNINMWANMRRRKEGLHEMEGRDGNVRPEKPIDASSATVQGGRIDKGMACTTLSFSSLIWRFSKTKYGLPTSGSLRVPT
ncbi:hypothetical protein NMY22_g10850 [Coprinellus aureogranulatus]|nr:hypothetical protein NMY22_g10850 [Coprinellus aureogranulatus]